MRRFVLFFLFMLLLVAEVGVGRRSVVEVSASSNVSLYAETGATMWQSNETVILTMGKIDLTERRVTRTQSFAHNFGWLEFHQREHFISYEEIFVELSEKFEWDKVNSNPQLGLGFPSWEKFAENLSQTSSWWLEYSWGLRSDWYGIVENESTIITEKTGNIASVVVRCHVRDVSEYIIGHSLRNIVFDLYSVDLGKIEVYEYYYDSAKSGQSVYLHLKAPSTILQQVKDKYTATISVAPQFQNTVTAEERVMAFVMPPPSEVESISPSASGSFQASTATFTISAGTKFPNSFSIVSGPPKKEITELLAENLTSPDRMLVLAAFGGLLFSSFQGASMLRRRKAYSRTAKMIAKVYEENNQNQEALVKELNSIHDSLYRMFVEDKITDDQFEKLHSLVHEHLPEIGK